MIQKQRTIQELEKSLVLMRFLKRQEMTAALFTGDARKDRRVDDVANKEK